VMYVDMSPSTYRLSHSELYLSRNSFSFLWSVWKLTIFTHPCIFVSVPHMCEPHSMNTYQKLYVSCSPVYLPTLSQLQELYSVEWEGYERTWSWSAVRFHPITSLESLKETGKTSVSLSCLRAKNRTLDSNTWSGTANHSTVGFNSPCQMFS